MAGNECMSVECGRVITSHGVGGILCCCWWTSDEMERHRSLVFPDFFSFELAHWTTVTTLRNDQKKKIIVERKVRRDKMTDSKEEKLLHYFGVVWIFHLFFSLEIEAFR